MGFIDWSLIICSCEKEYKWGGAAILGEQLKKLDPHTEKAYGLQFHVFYWRSVNVFRIISLVKSRKIQPTSKTELWKCGKTSLQIREVGSVSGHY